MQDEAKLDEKGLEAAYTGVANAFANDVTFFAFDATTEDVETVARAAIRAYLSYLARRPAHPAPFLELVSDFEAAVRLLHARGEASGADPEDEAGINAERTYEEARQALLRAASPQAAEMERPTHRHKKRGTEYVLIGYGKMQAEKWFAKPGDDPLGKDMPGKWTNVDMREVAVYRSVDDDSLWVRPREEFEDGRFEALHPQARGGENGK